MADELDVQLQNIISDLITQSAAEIATRSARDLLIARWNNNDAYNRLGLPGVAALITVLFPHLDQSKIGNSVTALTAIQLALGNDSSGQAANLINMKG